MATPEVLEFEKLLQPISGENPAGAELKEVDSLRSVYQAVKDAREAARSAEKKLYQARWLEEKGAAGVERPDWSKVHDLAVQAISLHSKDLWIAAWLIEALTRSNGFAGLRDGFRLVRELVERYWDGIHPRPDEDGHATTVAQLTGLNGDESEGALIAPIDRVPITAAGKIRALSNADYKQALELEKIADADKRAQRVEAGDVLLEMFDQAVRETPPDFFRTLREDIQQSIDEFLRLSETLDSRCGSAAPPTSSIRNALTDVRDRVETLARSVLEEPSESGEETTAAEGGTHESAQAAGAATAKGMSREEAFRQLLRVAEFFRRTEPHSPVSYSLEQAVRWGRMPLPELLAELVNDSAVRDELFKRMGIVQKEES